VIELDDGSALKLTIARYYTPNGRSIQEHGITPDVVVEQVKMADLKPQHGEEPQQKERDLAGHLRNTQDALARAPQKATATVATSAKLASPPSVAAAIGDDFQLKTAYDHLKAWQIFARPLPGAAGQKTAATAAPAAAH
jgi:carboxyl-terminal processing protease